MNDTAELPELPVYGFEPNLRGLLSLALLILLPIVVGLVTRKSTSPAWKAVLLFALAAVKTVLFAWVQAVETSVDFRPIPVVYSTLISFGIAVAIHFGLLKPLGIAGVAQRSLVKERPKPAPVRFD